MTAAASLAEALGPCDCWTSTYALGHDGHCCFLRDERAELKRSEAWRPDDEICHIPATNGGSDE